MRAATYSRTDANEIKPFLGEPKSFEMLGYVTNEVKTGAAGITSSVSFHSTASPQGEAIRGALTKQCLPLLGEGGTKCRMRSNTVKTVPYGVKRAQNRRHPFGCRRLFICQTDNLPVRVNYLPAFLTATKPAAASATTANTIAMLTMSFAPVSGIAGFSASPSSFAP